MKVLAACEESQAVAAAFRRLGHEAYSCDVEPCSGGHPEWHIQQDVLPLLDGFPDGWTRYGASGKEMSDNARIKALGNSIAVPCAERVFIGILAAEQEM